MSLTASVVANDNSAAAARDVRGKTIVISDCLAETLLEVLMALDLDVAAPKCHIFFADGGHRGGDMDKDDKLINAKRRL